MGTPAKFSQSGIVLFGNGTIGNTVINNKISFMTLYGILNYNTTAALNSVPTLGGKDSNTFSNIQGLDFRQYNGPVLGTSSGTKTPKKKKPTKTKAHVQQASHPHGPVASVKNGHRS